MPTLFLSKNGKGLSGAAYAFLILLCVAFYSPGFATLPATDRDESSFAQASKQMIETGNYVDIRLQQVPRYKKPIGIYWLQAASVQVLNRDHPNEIWAYRVPSFVSGVVSVATTAALGSLLFGPLVGFIASIMLAGCILLNVEARLATTDASLLASIMVMQYALARTYMKRGSRWLTFAFWSAIAAGFLLKGPIILMVLASTLGWLWFSEKNLGWCRELKPKIGIPYTILLTAPWFVAIMMQSHGDFARQSAGNDLLAKIWQGQNRGVLPPGFYLVMFPITFFPFSLFAFLGTVDTWKNRMEPAVRFCIGWIIPTWVAFELPLTKLMHYVLPLYPAIAILAAKALIDGYPALTTLTRRWYPALVTALWLVVGVGVAMASAALPVIGDGLVSLWQAGAGFLVIVAQGACLFLMLRKKPLAAVAVLASGFLIFTGIIFNQTLPGMNHFWLSRDAVTMARAHSLCREPHIVSAGYTEPSLVFLGGTKTAMVNDGADAAHALETDKCSVGLIDDKHKDAFLTAFKETKPFEAGHIEGLDGGRGKDLALTLYLPPAGEP